MTINEAIQHCDEVANTCKETECAAEHRQLAEWLRELVRLRKIKPLVEKIALEKIGAKIDVLEAEQHKMHWTDKKVVSAEEAGVEELQSARCSNCGRYHTTPYLYNFDEANYCPYCGLKKE